MRIGQQGARDRKHLLLAAGELSTPVVLALGQAGKGFVDAIDGPGAGSYAGGQSQVLGNAQ